MGILAIVNGVSSPEDNQMTATIAICVCALSPLSVIFASWACSSVIRDYCAGVLRLNVIGLKVQLDMVLD